MTDFWEDIMRTAVLAIVILTLTGCATLPGVEISEEERAACEASGCTVWTRAELEDLVREAMRRGGMWLGRSRYELGGRCQSPGRPKESHQAAAIPSIHARWCTGVYRISPAQQNWPSGNACVWCQSRRGA